MTSVPACGKHKRNNSGASALLKFVDNADCGAVQTFFLIMQPFPGICGRFCPKADPLEKRGKSWRSHSSLSYCFAARCRAERGVCAE